MELGSPGSLDSKESACNAGDWHSIPGSERAPGGGNGDPILLPGKSHGQRSLVGHSPWGRKESDTTGWLSMLSTYPREQATGHVDFSTCGHMFRPDNSDGPQLIWSSRGCMWPRLGQSVCSISFVTVIDWFREGHMTQAGPMKYTLRFLMKPLEKRSTYGEKIALLRRWKPGVAAGRLVTPMEMNKTYTKSKGNQS